MRENIHVSDAKQLLERAAAVASLPYAPAIDMSVVQHTIETGLPDGLVFRCLDGTGYQVSDGAVLHLRADNSEIARKTPTREQWDAIILDLAIQCGESGTYPPWCVSDEEVPCKNVERKD